MLLPFFLFCLVRTLLCYLFVSYFSNWDMYIYHRFQFYDKFRCYMNFILGSSSQGKTPIASFVPFEGTPRRWLSSRASRPGLSSYGPCPIEVLRSPVSGLRGPRTIPTKALYGPPAALVYTPSALHKWQGWCDWCATSTDTRHRMFNVVMMHFVICCLKIKAWCNVSWVFSPSVY